MRILIISDVHGNWEALKTVVYNEEYDMIISAGDTVDFGPEPRKCLECLKDKSFVSVLGNHDWAVAYDEDPGSINEIWKSICEKSASFSREDLGEDNLDFIRGFPLERYLEIDQKKIYIAHGSPTNPLAKYIEPAISDEELQEEFKDADADIVIIGHTHFPMMRELKDKLIINPGSVGQPKDGNTMLSYAILENGKVSFKRKRYNIEATLEALKKCNYTDIEYNQLKILLTTAIQPSMSVRQGIDRPPLIISSKRGGRIHEHLKSKIK